MKTLDRGVKTLGHEPSILNQSRVKLMVHLVAALTGPIELFLDKLFFGPCGIHIYLDA